MFNPVVGRFMQTDLRGFAAGDPNLYRYVGNSPTNATDPSGLEEKPGTRASRVLPRWFTDWNLTHAKGTAGVSYWDFYKKAFPELAQRLKQSGSTLDPFEELQRDTDDLITEKDLNTVWDMIDASGRGDEHDYAKLLQMLDREYKGKGGSGTGNVASPPAPAGSVSSKPGMLAGPGGFSGMSPWGRFSSEELRLQISAQLYWYGSYRGYAERKRREAVSGSDPRALYECDPEFRSILDELTAIVDRAKIAPPALPGGKPVPLSGHLALTPEGVDAILRVENVLSADALKGMRQAVGELEKKLNRRAHEIRVPRPLRYGEGATWALVETAGGVGEAIAYPDKVVQGLHKIATDPKAREAVWEEIKKKVENADTAEGAGALTVDITSLVTGAGGAVRTGATVTKTVVRVTITIPAETVKKWRTIAKNGGKIESKELGNFHPELWLETPEGRLAKLELPDDIPQMAKRPGANPAAKSWDWDHIFDNHSPTGQGAAQRNRPDQVFQGLTNDQITGVCKRAWAERKKVETQQNLTHGTRIKYQGTDPQTGRAVEFWFNLDDLKVETAYPLPGK